MAFSPTSQYRLLLLVVFTSTRTARLVTSSNAHTSALLEAPYVTADRMRRRLSSAATRNSPAIFKKLLSSCETRVNFPPKSATLARQPNDGLQLRRAISIRAEGKRLLEKDAIAPS